MARVRPLGQPLFWADWMEAVFIHYRVPGEILQPQVPFELDLYEGAAWVSLVAFTMRRMRPVWGGRLGAWLFRPLATCRFLNLRTYVQNDGEPGIFFMQEWISNPLCVPLGPFSFGLPYRRGRLDYPPPRQEGTRTGEIADRTGRSMRWQTEAGRGGELAPAATGSREEFLLERYTAFTVWRGWQRAFRIRHRPWRQESLGVRVENRGLLAGTGPWFRAAELAGANFSPGVCDVQISWPGKTSAV